MTILKNKKGDSFCKMEGDGIVYVDVSNDSLSISFRVIRGDRDYVDSFIERIKDVYDDITEKEFDKTFYDVLSVIENFKTNLKLPGNE